MRRAIAVSGIIAVALASLTVSAQQRTPAAPASTAQSARPQSPTYFPERFEWQHRRPEEVGMNAALVAEAVKAAADHEIAGSREVW